MATLVVKALDISGNALSGVQVIVRLTDVNGQPLHEFSTDGLLINPIAAVTGSDGTVSIQLVPNEDIQRDNTYYTVNVGGQAPVLIEKGSGTESLLASRVISPLALGPAATLDSLGDVDLTGIANGNTIRMQAGKFVPWAWPGGGGGGADKPWVTLNSATTLTSGDVLSRHKADAALGAFTVTLPSPIGLMGNEFTVKRVNSGSNLVTVSCPQGMDGATNYVLDMQWESVTVSSDNSQWMVI